MANKCKFTCSNCGKRFWMKDKDYAKDTYCPFCNAINHIFSDYDPFKLVRHTKMKKENKTKIVCEYCGQVFWVKTKYVDEVGYCPFCGTGDLSVKG